MKVGYTRSQKSESSESWYSYDDSTSLNSLAVEGFSGHAFSTWLNDCFSLVEFSSLLG